MTEVQGGLWDPPPSKQRWGWGAHQIRTPDPGWRCDDCGWTATERNTKQRGVHAYLFGGERCTPCARAFHDATYKID